MTQEEIDQIKMELEWWEISGPYKGTPDQDEFLDKASGRISALIKDREELIKENKALKAYKESVINGRQSMMKMELEQAKERVARLEKFLVDKITEFGEVQGYDKKDNL